MTLDSPQKRRDWLPLLLFGLALVTHFAHFLSAPPGLLGDASRLGIHTVDFLQERVWPFYIYHLFAPNPLIIYLQAPIFAIFGYTPQAVRGLTAFFGALATPALYLACRALFRNDSLQLARRAGIIAALGLALSPYFTAFSRYGTEHILLPVFELAAVALLWRGFNRGRWFDFCLAGIIVGLSQYTYIVARFFPLALGIATLIALLANRNLLARWKLLFLAGVSAALVALPQWLMFIRAPYTFSARTSEEAGQFIFGLPNAGSIFGAKLLNQLLMLGGRWDNAYNPFSDLPLLTPILVIFLLVGLLSAGYTRKASQLFAVAMFVLMLVPDLLAYEGLNPSATRLYPAVPFIMLVAGLGGARLWQWLEGQSFGPGWLGYAIPVLVVLGGLIRQYDYAVRVIPQVQAMDGLEWRASLVELAEADYIARHLDEAILIPASEYERAPLTFLLAEHYPNRTGAWPPPLTSGETVTIIAPTEPDRPTTEGIPSGYIPNEWVLLKDDAVWFLPPLPQSVKISEKKDEIVASNGVRAAQVFSGQWEDVTPEITPTEQAFSNGIKLVGYQASPLTPGGTLTVTLYLQAETEIDEDVQLFVQLLDREQNAVSALHEWPLHGAYRLRAWDAGETIPLSYKLSLPPEMPPGGYQLIAGLFSLIHQEPIPLDGGAEHALVTVLKIPLPPAEAVPAQQISAQFGPAIALTGYTLTPQEGTLGVNLFWTAREVPGNDYTIFLHIVDESGQIVAQSDVQPGHGRYPTSIWSAGERVTDELSIPLPAEIEAGDYQIYVGLYQWDTLERLEARLNGERAVDDRLLLDTIKLP